MSIDLNLDDAVHEFQSLVSKRDQCEPGSHEFEWYAHQLDELLEAAQTAGFMLKLLARLSKN